MLALVEMFGSVLVFRGIAAANVAALEAEPQMYPSVSGFDTIFTDVLLCAGDPDVIEMRACNGHGGPPLPDTRDRCRQRASRLAGIFQTKTHLIDFPRRAHDPG
jgi:hypothetical protein